MSQQDESDKISDGVHSRDKGKTRISGDPSLDSIVVLEVQSG